MTESERFAGKLLAALGDTVRTKFTGPSEDGVQLVVSEKETGINFTIIVESPSQDRTEET